MTTSKLILVTLHVTELQRQKLAAQAPGCTFIYQSAKELTPETLRRAQIIIGGVPTGMLAGADQLEWLQLGSAGAREYAAAGVLPPGVLLTNATGAYGLAISEHMLGMLLEIQKKLYLYRDNQKQSRWHDEGEVTAIEGSRTLVVGLGDIGGEFARKMKALGSTTVGIKKHLASKPDYLDELHTLDDLDDLLPQADIVALCLPDTPETAGLFSKDRLGRLKATAILLNVGRGNVIDTESLCDQLAMGHLAGVGVDVTDPEPLPPEHRLWSIQNAVITPHVAGSYHLPATLERVFAIAAANLGRYLRGEELENLVDFQTGYRRFRES